MLQAFAVPLVWNELKNAFTTGDTVLDSKLQAFAQYFNGTWVNGDFNPQLWTHFDHTGPRTTNLAEGFHNSLNSRLGMPPGLYLPGVQGGSTPCLKCLTPLLIFVNRFGGSVLTPCRRSTLPDASSSTVTVYNITRQRRSSS